VNALLPTIVSLKQTLKAIAFAFERPQLSAAFNHHAGRTYPFVQNLLGLCL
jgi:hypothetical protein